MPDVDVHSTRAAGETHSGRCLCGAFRYTVEGPLGEVRYCHCSQCQRGSGTAFSANAKIDRAQWRLEGPQEEITEFELEQDGVKLRVCRSGAGGLSAGGSGAAGQGGGPTVAAPSGEATGTGPAPRTGQSPEVEEEGGPAGGTAVPSPIVGTFYRAPDPNSPPFVSVGDQVQVGQVLCIVEAIKLMNEIEAETAGKIVKIHPDNGQPVQYGDTLFTIRPA